MKQQISRIQRIDMNNELNKVVRVLKTFFWASIAIAVMFVVLYESHVLLSGGLQMDGQGQFMLQTVSELATLIAIPLALYMFRVKGIKQLLVANPAVQLTRFGILRLLMLGAGIVSNTLFYYMTMTPSYGYMAIILLIAMTFVYPTKQRCIEETSQ